MFYAVAWVFSHTRNTKMSMIEAIKTKINNHQVPALDQVWGTVSYRPMGFNGLIIGFDSHIKELSQVKVGTSFKLCSGKPIVKYRLIVESESGRVKFNWKDGVKPSGWLKIERDLLMWWLMWHLFGNLLRIVEKHSQSQSSYVFYDDSQLSYRTDFIEVLPCWVGWIDRGKDRDIDHFGCFGRF